jgi:hypothetical protein
MSYTCRRPVLKSSVAQKCALEDDGFAGLPKRIDWVLVIEDLLRVAPPEHKSSIGSVMKCCCPNDRSMTGRSTRTERVWIRRNSLQVLGIGFLRLQLPILERLSDDSRLTGLSWCPFSLRFPRINAVPRPAELISILLSISDLRPALDMESFGSAYAEAWASRSRH